MTGILKITSGLQKEPNSANGFFSKINYIREIKVSKQKIKIKRKLNLQKEV